MEKQKKELISDRLVVADAENGFTYIGKIISSEKDSSMVLEKYIIILTKKLYGADANLSPNAISHFERATLAYGDAIRDSRGKGNFAIARGSIIKLNLEKIVARQEKVKEIEN